MDVSIAELADPKTLGQEIQTGVDSVAGQHIDMASIRVLLNAIADIEPIPIIVNIVIIFILIFLTFTAAKIVDRMLKNYIPKVANRGKVKMEETVQLMIRRLATAAIYITGILLVILQIPQLHNLATAVLASAGIAGLAIGFAAKDTLSNFISGVFIVVFQPFRVGDHIDFKGEYGEIEDLTLRHTVICTWDNRRIIVPNSLMSTEPIINWSIRESEITWTVDFKIGKISDLDRAREIIIEVARSHPTVLANREIKVLLTDMKDEELNLRLEVHLPGRDVAKGVGCEIREAVGKRFDQEGIAPSVSN